MGGLGHDHASTRARWCQDGVVTTRTLVILRHAKAANPDGVADVDRPLTRRGHADAAAAGAWLVQRGLTPDIVLCSPSRRTRETWHGVALALSAAPEVRYEKLIYAGSHGDLLDVVRSAPPTATTALLIGHNPAVSRLSIALDPGLADRDGLRTAAVAVHAWDGDWADCAPDAGQLTASHTARADV
jgi:phosphohistidine phosphatase